MPTATRSSASPPTTSPRWRAALAAQGAKLFVCAYGCQKRRLPLAHGDTVTYCGLVVLTDLINGTDRFVALN